MPARIISTPVKQKGEYGNQDEERKPFRSSAYLALVGSLPCCVTGCTDAKRDAHHVRLGAYQAGKRVPDSLTVPLLHTLHIDQYAGALHKVGERKFWTLHGIDPVKLADGLHEIWEAMPKHLQTDMALKFMALRRAIAASRRT